MSSSGLHARPKTTWCCSRAARRCAGLTWAASLRLNPTACWMWNLLKSRYFRVRFEPAQRGRFGVDRVLAQPLRLLEVDEVGPFDSFIFRDCASAWVSAFRAKSQFGRGGHYLLIGALRLQHPAGKASGE